jgi:NitT/TauT family transport system substrate-binding protein
MTYVGPNPALNAFIRSGGQDVRVVCGAVRGGAALVVAKGQDLKEPADFKGKKIATPQLANTQDIACRYWFKQAGLTVRLDGGDVFIVPTPNASMPGLFATRGVDAAWTVEPWVSRLELEAGASLVYAEPEAQSPTTVLVAGETLLRENPELVKQFVEAHKALNEWIIQNPEEAQKRVAAELTRQMRREFPLSLVQHAWPRLIFSTEISRENFDFSLKMAQEVGFIKGEHNLSAMVVTP